MSSMLKFVIGGAVVVAVIVVLMVTNFTGSTSQYLKIAEVKALGPDQARASRVSGAIVKDSVQWTLDELHLTFEITDSTGTLPISYFGPKPDMLVDAVEAVAIGKFDAPSGVFQAEELLMKCPSKYEEAK